MDVSRVGPGGAEWFSGTDKRLLRIGADSGHCVTVCSVLLYAGFGRSLCIAADCIRYTRAISLVLLQRKAVSDPLQLPAQLRNGIRETHTRGFSRSNFGYYFQKNTK